MLPRLTTCINSIPWQVHRTSEPLLLDALTDLRAGVPGTAAVGKLLDATRRPLPPRDGVEATTLYPKKTSVAQQNAAKLLELDLSTRQQYVANDAVELSEDAPWWVKKEEMLGDKFFTEDCQAGKHLELRLHAQVMLLRNETASTDETERRDEGLHEGGRDGAAVGGV